MSIVLGIDEVGVGALAGPAFVALVAFDKIIPTGLRDSKKTSAAERIRMDSIIRQHAVICEIGIAPLADIEALNIRGAVNKAIENTFEKMFSNSFNINNAAAPDQILMDGIIPPKIPGVRCIKGGDILIPAISAASIVAKVARDKFMTEIGVSYPVYWWNKNAGYPTKKHKEAINCYGISRWHRVDYLGVKGCTKIYEGCC